MIISLGTLTLFFSFLSILTAKVLLVLNMRTAISSISSTIDLHDCFRIYNLTQLAKYIPGSIWQFLGKIAILKERGIPLSDIQKILIAEHLWILVSASFLAIGILFQVDLASFHQITLKTAYLVTLSLGLIFILGAAISYRNNISRLVRFYWPSYSTIITLFSIWLLLGFSLWVTIDPFVRETPSLLYIVSAYCFAYVIGFLVPFSPAGLGIREALLTLFLMPYIGQNEAIFLAAVNRVVYFFVEILLALLSIKRPHNGLRIPPTTDK